MDCSQPTTGHPALPGGLFNLQGDIVAILDSNGTAVVNYKYDAWGKPFTPTGSMANTLGKINPFRYRGYVYDEETGLYYLRSRYFNPARCRFLNADIFLGHRKPLTHNIYSYCENSCVISIDPDGFEEEKPTLEVYVWRSHTRITQAYTSD